MTYSFTLRKLLVLAAAAMPIGAFAADKIGMAVGGMEKRIHLPAKLAPQLGYFKVQDLDVEMINTRAGVEAENEFISDEG